jgi:hypothetical protein
VFWQSNNNDGQPLLLLNGDGRDNPGRGILGDSVGQVLQGAFANLVMRPS